MKGDNKQKNGKDGIKSTNKTKSPKKYSLRSRSKKNEDKIVKKKAQSSSSSSSSSSEEEEFDQAEFGKMLSQLFPSKYINERVEEILKEKGEYYEDESDEEDEEEEIKYKKNKRKMKKKIQSESEEEEEEEEEETSEETSENEDEEMYGTIYSSKRKAFNILVCSDDHSRYYDNDDEESNDETSEETEQMDDDDDKEIEYTKADDEILEKFNKIASQMKKSKKYKDAPILKELVKIGNQKRKQISKSNKKQRKKGVKKNMKEFNKLIRDKKKDDDYSIFKKMELDEQSAMLKKLEQIKKYNDDEVPMRIRLLNTDIPVNYKSVAMRKMNTLEFMEPGSNEYYKLKQWVDTFMRIPFNKYSNLPITIEDGVEKCHNFMQNAQTTLDEAVFGLNDAKMQIIQMLGQWITNPNAIGTAIAIKGPMGTGKTTLVKDGISKILGREFAFIALGGATDSSILEGHSYTYEGSTWGKIVDILVQCKSMNPVIYFDELDKISNTPKGEEIASVLTHLTDTTQNNQFHDKYFSEIELDLSKCLFIFSYNEEEKVNPILKDRMYRISTKGYTAKEKNTIVQKYLLPKIREQLKFKQDEIIIPDDVLRYTIEKYTHDEDGVRNLKRCLETIYRKMNLFKLMKPGVNLFESDLKLDVTFPVTMTNDMIDKIIKMGDEQKNQLSMYM